MRLAPLQYEDLTDEQLARITSLVKARCGIDLQEGKKELVKARLGKRMRALGLSSYHEYLRCLAEDLSGDEMVALLDAVSTNLTYFFREGKHLDHFRRVTLPALCAWEGESARIRIWSAGCSSGDEPYSIAILLHEELADIRRRDVAVLATDLSTRVLAAARQGVYDAGRLRETPPAIVSKYFQCVQRAPAKRYCLRDDVRRLVTFARLNLMDPWPMRGPFDAIFCRNVMIYFDRPTQADLARRFCDLLAPGGTLFIGHSENLASSRERFRLLQPAVYQKC